MWTRHFIAAVGLMSVVISAQLAVPLLAQGVKPAAATVPAELKPFEGVWKPVSIQVQGQEQADSKAQEKIRLSIEGSQYKLFFVVDAGKGLGHRVALCALEVDDSKKTMRLTFLDGPKKGEKLHGIYEVSARSLKLCYGPADKPAPTKFEAPKDSVYFLESWVREK